MSRTVTAGLRSDPDRALAQANNATELRTIETQNRFLEEYQRVGTIKSAATAANVSRETVYQWQRTNRYGFGDRFRGAQETFREELEEIMFERLRDPKTNPVLLIFALKGHYREKYGDSAQSTDDAAKQTLAELRQMRRESQEEASAT